VKKLKPRKSEPSLREQLSEPLRAFVSDFKINGADALRKVREESPTKYLELTTKLLPLIVALNPAANDFADCQNMADVGARLLKSIGLEDDAITEPMVEAALETNSAFIARLEQIARDAQGEELN
jgi:hypothetical protein